MKYRLLLLVLFLILLLSNCKTNTASGNHLVQSKPSNWMTQFDFDGDGNQDIVYYDYSGGAHCCYTVTIVLTGTNRSYVYPFELDGGYLFGLDLSQPDHFNIKDFDHDGLPEIYMEINTYNGEKLSLPAEWTEEYGITSNYIIIDYKNDKLMVRDWVPE